MRNDAARALEEKLTCVLARSNRHAMITGLMLGLVLGACLGCLVASVAYRRNLVKINDYVQRTCR
jgi:hypothetical protein